MAGAGPGNRSARRRHGHTGGRNRCGANEQRAQRRIRRPQANPESYGSYIFAGNSNPNYSSTVPTSGDNLLSFTLDHSAGASGTFEIIAFASSNVNTYSNWTYYNQANPSDPDNFSNYAFSNIPATGSFPANPGTFVLGTISVNPAAVPEPASMVLAGIATAGCAGYGWRQRRKAASAVPEELGTDAPTG